MPKSLDKTKGAKKRKKPSNNSNANTESDSSGPKPVPKKKKRAIEGIQMSQQLAAEVQKKRQLRVSQSRNKPSARVCGNGKPMPSLAELEAMYTDSEDDGATDPPKPTLPERCVTPKQEPVEMNEQNLNSPTTLELMASKVIDLISKTIVLDDDDTPKPIKPPKRPKKSDVPYIVGCKDRRQVPWAPKTKFCVGSEKYGVEDDSDSADDDNGCPKKRRRRGKKMNLSKSIFNAKSDEIAERLLERESLERVHNSSPDSNDTVTYEVNEQSMNRSFEPLPSTSKDQETIMQNEKRFTESFLSEQSNIDDSQNDVEVIEVPCETITLDDTARSYKHKHILDDDCCVIIEPETDKKNDKKETCTNPDSPQDNLYSSIDLTQPVLDNEVYVIGDDDIDDVIAQNEAILGMNPPAKNNNNGSTVIVVNPDDIEPSVTSKTNSDVNVAQSNICPSDTSSNDKNNNSSNDTTPRQTTQGASNDILNVVTNFFSQPLTSNENICNHSRSTLSAIVSWMSSIASNSILSGHQSRGRTPNTDDVIVVDDVQRARQNNHNNIPNNVTNNCNLTNHNSRVSDINPTHRNKTNNNKRSGSHDCDPTQQLSSNPSHQDSQPVRSVLGDCPICMDSLASTTLASTICGHIFCMACIKAAVKANGKKCPTCRKPLKGVGYHQLFL